MLFNNESIRAFFTAEDQIGLPQPIYERLVEEGINTVADLSSIEDDDWNRLHKNVEVRIPAATRGGDPILRRLPAMSVSKLKVASAAVRYFECVGRPLEVENMRWSVLKHFKEEHASIKSLKDSNTTEVPKVSKSVPVLKWLESFETFLGNVIGSRDIPLSYVIRADEVPSLEAPPLAEDLPYSTIYGSISKELVARATFRHPLFREDSKKVLQYLDEALSGSTYAHAISKFRRSNNGREAFIAVKSQHGGADKWKLAKEKAISDMRNSSWNGTGTITVSAFINKHRSAFDDLERCATYLQAVEVPSERARVDYLLKGVAECNNVQFKSMVATIQSQEDDDDGPYASFEKTASLLLKVCPVTKNAKKRVRINPEVSLTEVPSLSKNIKKGPKTGVDIRYYKPAEWMKLSKEAKQELRECKRKNHEMAQNEKGKGKKDTDPKQFEKRMKKIAVDALKAHVEEEKVEKEKGLLQEIASIVSSSASSGNSNATVQSITRLLKENGKSGN
jgi:hypothetical protein